MLTVLLFLKGTMKYRDLLRLKTFCLNDKIVKESLYLRYLAVVMCAEDDKQDVCIKHMQNAKNLLNTTKTQP